MMFNAVVKYFHVMSYLLYLPLHLQEKIVTKVLWKSYFRVQQTCRHMADLIRTSRNIKICLPPNFFLEVLRNENGQIRHYLYFDAGRYCKLDMESLYGIRFYGLTIRGNLGDHRFPTYCCDMFKKYNITSNSLDMHNMTACSKEQYEEIMKTLKPEWVELRGSNSNQFEAVLNTKGVKDVILVTHIDDVQDLNILQEFLAKFRNLHVFLDTDGQKSLYHEFKRLLQYLRSTPLPNLHNFHFELLSRTENPAPLATLEELLELFRDFNPVLLQTNDNENYDQYTIECRLGLANCYCVLTIGRYISYLIFRFVDEQVE